MPQPGPGELLIKVHASALNRGELLVGGVMHGGPEKLGGNEVWGTVEEVGDGVSSIKVDDSRPGAGPPRVRRIRNHGSGAGDPNPARLTWEQAAATPLSFITAYEMAVTFGKLREGEWLDR